MKTILTNLIIAAIAATVGIVMMDVFLSIMEQFDLIGNLLENTGRR
ncbi:hypothetical protein [Nitrosomonas sp. HPC101]|nr:hypothetical protein [Nitrosomonas sp. HPC101]